MKHLLRFILIASSIHICNIKLTAEEITLFNSEGEAIAYIDASDENLTIYMWNGTPVAYLDPDGSKYNIYGYNGIHLGWFEDGTIIDHEGYVVGFKEGAVSIYTKYEPYKSFKQYKPFASFKQFAPFKPFSRNQFSTEPLSLFLMRGKK